jgi:hypothetical protein
MADSNKVTSSLLCPSARSNKQDNRVFGIIGGTVEVPEVNYLKEPQWPAEYMARLSDTKITPEEVFRIASPCEEKGCKHFDGRDCQLVVRVVEQLTSVSESLPACAIRRDCRWWRQEGKNACMRCSQVVTDYYSASALMMNVAKPQ